MSDVDKDIRLPIVMYENERATNYNDTNLPTILSSVVDEDTVDDGRNVAGCNGCNTVTKTYETRDTTSLSLSDDVSPTISHTDSTGKSDDDSARNTFAAKKGKAEGNVCFF